MSQDILWIYNPLLLIKNYTEFFPIKTMNNIRKYNAIVRYLLYNSILFILFGFSIYWIFLFIIGIIYITYIGLVSTKPKKITKKICRDTTIDNPAANYLMMDKQNIDSCDINPQKKMENVRYNLYEDTTHMKKRHLLDRTFYTKPVTNYPNNIHKIGKFMYNNNDKCKNENDKCEDYRDIRFIR